MAARIDPLTQRKLDAGYRELATLADGSAVALRPIRPADAPLMRDGLRQLSERTRYQRFLAPKPEFSPDELRFLTEVDGEAHFALAAVATHSRSLVGVGRFFRATVAAPEAEVALVVADPVQGKGLGRLLFARLCEAALERGVRRFTGLMLDENRAMRGLLRKLGGRVGLASYGVCEIEVQLG